MRCVTIVRFPAPPPLTPEELDALLEDGMPPYRSVPGLLRKYFIGNREHAGGVYEWDCRTSADAWFTAGWRADMRTRYGADPVVEHFDLPALVDNEAGSARRFG